MSEQNSTQLHAETSPTYEPDIERAHAMANAANPGETQSAQMKQIVKEQIGRLGTEAEGALPSADGVSQESIDQNRLDIAEKAADLASISKNEADQAAEAAGQRFDQEEGIKKAA